MRTMFSAILSLSFLILALQPQAAIAEFPAKPIKIVVYTSPGGLIDVTARKIGAILQKKHVHVPVVIENKKGAGGLIALNHVVRQPADGYTLFALTNSVISTALAAKQDRLFDRLEFLTRVVEDYESIIVQKESEVQTLKQLVAKAKAKPGTQLWSGPARGGTDHLFAQRFWSAADIQVKWIPYRSGSEAIASLLGGHSTAYVGNPSDTIGRPDLKILAVASPKRLGRFQDVPTFEELGFPALTGESLWRGIALPQGVPAEEKKLLMELFRKVQQDEEWIAFIQSNGLLPMNDTPTAFAAAVKAQVEQEKKLSNS